MADYRRVYDSGLTAKNRDQLRNRNPTLGNRVWATFAFLVATGPAEQ